MLVIDPILRFGDEEKVPDEAAFDVALLLNRCFRRKT
jgi:hypothetical protein